MRQISFEVIMKDFDPYRIVLVNQPIRDMLSLDMAKIIRLENEKSIRKLGFEQFSDIHYII